MLPSARRVIDVAIVDDSRLRACEAACGVDWSAQEALGLAGRQIIGRFGAGVRLSYLDAAQNDGRIDALPLEKIVSAGGFFFPLLIINGRLKISGGFDYRQLMEAIEAETEIGGV